jgi:hypothetical protein
MLSVIDGTSARDNEVAHFEFVNKMTNTEARMHSVKNSSPRVHRNMASVKALRFPSYGKNGETSRRYQSQ